MELVAQREGENGRLDWDEQAGDEEGEGGEFGREGVCRRDQHLIVRKCNYPFMRDVKQLLVCSNYYLFM